MSFFVEKNKRLTVYDLQVNQESNIMGFDQNLDLKIKQRLLELGFVSGANISIQQKSILGDVLLVNVNNYLMAIRKDIAKYIIVNLV